MKRYFYLGEPPKYAKGQQVTITKDIELEDSSYFNKKNKLIMLTKGTTGTVEFISEKRHDGQWIYGIEKLDTGYYCIPEQYLTAI